MWRILAPALLLLAGCEQLPPTPEDIQAKRFEAVPGKSLIYVVRSPQDSQQSSGLILDDQATITTHPGTYYRWEVAPGTHRVAGFGNGTEQVTLTTAPGQMYFLAHTVLGHWRAGPQITRLQQISSENGRSMVAQSVMLR